MKESVKPTSSFLAAMEKTDPLGVSLRAAIPRQSIHSRVLEAAVMSCNSAEYASLCCGSYFVSSLQNYNFFLTCLHPKVENSTLHKFTQETHQKFPSSVGLAPKSVVICSSSPSLTAKRILTAFRSASEMLEATRVADMCSAAAREMGSSSLTIFL